MVAEEKSILLVGMGDSITYGFPYTLLHSWLDIVCKNLDIAYINQGVCGDTTDGMLNRFEMDVLRLNPKYVIIMGGTNDIYMGVPIKNITDNIQSMVQLAQEHSVLPIVGIPIPCNEATIGQELVRLHQELKQIMIANQVEYIDFYEALVAQKGICIRAGLDSDGVHPNQEGYKQMALVAFRKLKDIV